ncbi:10051_t:CDS:2, partial [Ambispora leptoticha]
MEDYELIKEVGDGSFGVVLQAQHKSTGQLVAVKKMKKKISSWEKVCELREFKTLRCLPSHPNVIGLLEAFLIPQTRELYFVFEFMQVNLYQIIKDRKGKLFSERVFQSIMFQVLQGVHHIHSCGLFHRDLKPENILISMMTKTLPLQNNDGNIVNCSLLHVEEDHLLCYDDHQSHYQQHECSSSSARVQSNKNDIAKMNNKDDDNDNIEYIVKIGDFGLAREIKSRPPYTDYVSTRWYRAPEVLLRSTSYSAPIDLWAIGAIMAELYTLKPLFPGQSEIDQMFRICTVLGHPSSTCIDNISGQTDDVGGGEWKEGLKLAKNIGFVFPSTPSQPLSKIFPSTTPESLLQMITSLLRYNPKNRLTALDALKHPYFAEANLVVDVSYLEEKSMSMTTKVIEKKRKNDFSTLRKLAQGVTPVPYDKKNTRYSWSKAEELQKQKKIEQQIETIAVDRTSANNTLSPLNIDAANDIRQKEFVLPTIKAVSPFGSEQPIIGENSRYISSADGVAHEQRPRDRKLSLSINDDGLERFHGSRSAPPLSRVYLPETPPSQASIKNSTSEIEHLIDLINNPNKTTGTNVVVMPTQKFGSKIGQKRSRSNTTGDIDQM